ncbi:hypothetical protein CERZMDRAFT_102608 [Cercospora zeae-maydis SCOH1-5]|uniref:Uncharacterized protein n=1 Tax=Cercospora zeae-maydis SCOH1-5 TaxID=717836 RepID=A0A6A6F067_9PEZI|nr:hypothetical protein CERZMDRAFT_102608 [Cercospora zeae-maydis SCOH1-5]
MGLYSKRQDDQPISSTPLATIFWRKTGVIPPSIVHTEPFELSPEPSRFTMRFPKEAYFVHHLSPSFNMCRADWNFTIATVPEDNDAGDKYERWHSSRGVLSLRLSSAVIAGFFTLANPLSESTCTTGTRGIKVFIFA